MDKTKTTQFSDVWARWKKKKTNKKERKEKANGLRLAFIEDDFASSPPFTETLSKPPLINWNFTLKKKSYSYCTL